MKTRWQTRAALIAAGSIVAALAAGNQAARAQSGGRALTAADFVQHAPRGFGDPNNSWAQSMVWWKGALFVGTTRQSLCTSYFAFWQFANATFGRQFADLFLPYPPPDPDLACPADGADLSLQAEIWRWTPDDAWLRVYQSPLDLDNPGAGPPQPPRTGKKLPYEIGFRGLAPFTEPDGTEALYAFSVNSTAMWNRAMLPPPRILRTTDGITFTPVPQTPGTFLGDFPFNPDHSSFRSPAAFAGKLFVLSGPIFGQGSLIGSSDPAKGDDAWFLAGPPDLFFYEMAAFNGWLYLGTYNPYQGYGVMKTRAQGPPPYRLVTVVAAGAYHPEPGGASKSVVSMHVYGGRLYVGTGTQTEIIRINADDTWDLVIGPPRLVPSANGAAEWKYPTSGLDAGFGQTLNDHAWQMEEFFQQLYIGTFNASIGSKNDAVHAPLLAHNMGAHLYRTEDGWYVNAVTTDGFAKPSEPGSGRFDFGIRTMAATPYGAFLGTTNDYAGLAIYHASGPRSDAPDPPRRLEIEPAARGGALLSWKRAKDAPEYQIWRAEVRPIFVRNAIIGMIADTHISPYEQIGTADEPFYVDRTVETGRRYMYYVVAVHRGRVSDQSNLAAFPLLRPPVTFAQLLHEARRWEARARFVSPARGRQLRDRIERARALAAGCDLKQAVTTLGRDNAPQYLLEPDAVDLEVLRSRLSRRLDMFRQVPGEVTSAEFCTSP